ncbi:MAG TPA: hypothetical protein VGK67_28500 [Myxococcales bacterium]|jgi:hypothetical protein
MTRTQQLTTIAKGGATWLRAASERLAIALTPALAEPGDEAALRRLQMKSWAFWAAAGAVFYGAYQPGIFYFADSYAHLADAITLRFNAWHPPILPLLWGILFPFLGVRAPLVLHCAAFFGAFGLLSHCFIASRRRMSLSLVLLAFTAPALLHLKLVAKDTSLATMVALLAALYLFGRDRPRSLPRGIAVALALFYAANVRYALFVALAPLAGLFVHARFAGRAPSRRRMALAMLVGLGITSTFTVLNRLAFEWLYHPKPAESSHLLYFDMVGTLAWADALDEMPAYAVRDPDVGPELRRAYAANPLSADVFSPWGAARALVRQTEMTKVAGDWLRIVTAHPLAYLRHRGAFAQHALTSVQLWPEETKIPPLEENFLLPRLVSFLESTGLPSARARAAGEDLVYSTVHRPNAVSDLVDRYVHATRWLLLPLVHLVFEVAVAGWLFVKRRYDLRFALAASAALGIGMNCFSAPAVDLRYVYWCLLSSVLILWCSLTRPEDPPTAAARAPRAGEGPRRPDDPARE